MASPSVVSIDEIHQGAVNGVDLLLVIDNSISMGDKQALLVDAVPELVSRFANPRCTDPSSGETAAPPASPREPCPAPFVREFQPAELHVGVISSSLGSAGTPACAPDGSDPLRDEQMDDRGHLIGGRPRALHLWLAATAEGTPGFLRWNPNEDIGDFTSTFQELVQVVGERGCAYESPLEAMYRFLVDPAPPAEVEIVPCSPTTPADCARAAGVDEALLAQRRQFLRSGSLLSIVMISDENDCSVQQTGQLYYAMRDIALPRSTPVCATNPNDPCCYSCALNPPEECIQPKPAECTGPDGLTAMVPAEADHLNLRCWDQKRRFGIDFLYPVKRYVNALTEPMLCPATADLDVAACGDEAVPNPIFQEPSGWGAPVRSPSQVLLAGILGVPWQDIMATTTPDGDPYPPGELHFLTAAQMLNEDNWTEILGEPSGGSGSVPSLPADPLMHESIAPRSGTHLATGQPLVGPNSGYLANSVNGHEWSVVSNDDLQYACIFPLGQPRDCATVAQDTSCDCQLDAIIEQNPLCQAEDGTYSSVQRFAKAYPGLRQLEVLEGLEGNGIVASICARNTTDPTAQDYGYRPAIDALVRRASEEFQGNCFADELPLAGGAPTCRVVEAVRAPAGCDRLGRAELSSALAKGVFEQLQSSGACEDTACDDTGWKLCEILQSTADHNGDDTADCLQDMPAGDVGWCYIDPARGVGDAVLVESCPVDQKRLVRFVDPDQETPSAGARVFVACN